MGHIDAEYEFDLDKLGNGFQIAFGWTAYDNNYEMLDEPEYGELKAIMMTWNGDEGFNIYDVPFRPCTDEELGLGPDGFDDPRSRFY